MGIRLVKKNEATAPEEVNTVLKKNAPKLIDILNAKFKAAGFDVALKLADPENASFSDGWYLNTKSTGNWDDKSRMFNLRLAGTEYNGVVYQDGNIYLKKGARPASHRGVVVHPFGASALSESGLNAYTFAEPSFDAITYGLEEISKNDSGEIEVVDAIDSDGSAQALANEVDALHKRHPEKKYHIIAIGTDSDGIEDISEVIWSDYPEEVSVEEKAPAKTEATLNALWCVEFGDIYSNVKKEYFGTEAEAKARYDELAERGDIEWVEKPAIETVSKEETLSYDDYAESVKAILMGREFEYGPETANEFVVDDYKDIVRKNFDAGKGAFAAAADIDDAYMGKE